MMDSLSIVLFVVFLPCFTGQSMESIPSSLVVKKPGETLSLSCRGSGFSFSCCSMHWIRQPAGKGLQWMGRVYSHGRETEYSSSFQNRIEIRRDNSNSVVYLTLPNLKPEDSAVYYCAKHATGAFDYWGKGTEVTVSSGETAAPSLFPVTPCDTGSGDSVTLGCLAQDFYPKTATFQWTSTSNTQVASQQYIFPQQNVNRFTGVSVISVPRENALSYTCSVAHPAGNKSVPVKVASSPPSVTLLSQSDGEKRVLFCFIENLTTKQASFSWKKNNNNEGNFKILDPTKDGNAYIAASILKINEADWDSEAVYTCEVTHAGQTYIKKASKETFTVTLNPPSPKAIFVNKQAELKCVVTGLDGPALSNTKIKWFINDQPVANNISESKDAQSKTSTLIRNFNDWKKVNKVKCDATRENTAPITKSLDVKRGVAMPDVQLLKLSENTREVTLVCLVTSPEQQDYYIAWSEASGNNQGPYNDGHNLSSEKLKNGYLVSSFYTTSKANWSTKKFSCNVWPANSDVNMKAHELSSSSDSNVPFAFSCIDNLSEGDDSNGLWSTTSSFIFLFIFSLTYNMIFILVQVKK